MSANKNNKQLIYFSIISIFLVISAFSSGFFLQNYLTTRENDLTILHESYRILQEHALIQLPPEKELEYGMIRGMLKIFDDPYTIFVEPPQHELQTNQLEGKFGGIGARLEKDNQNNLLLYPFPDSPASKAGIIEGDRLIAVEDLIITHEMSMEEIQAAIRGPVNKKVTLAIGRAPDFTQQTFSIKREEVALPSVTWNLASIDPSVGVIQINLIAATTPDEVITSVEDLKTRGATHFIIDLRGNNGGLVEAGVKTAGLFLDKGTVLEQQYREQPVESLDVDKAGPYIDLPIVVLVNNTSASAAEIVAGALKGQNRALIIGSPTYGKDKIQLVFDLSDGSSLHVTAARWWIPGLEHEIGVYGLQPDIIIAEELTNQPAMMEIAIENLLSQP